MVGTARQVDAPSSMNRQSAARAYHTYINWGYFQRRMSLQREAGGDVDAESGREKPDSSADPSCSESAASIAPPHRSYAGIMCNRLWRGLSLARNVTFHYIKEGC
jgi:hypothetical protein